jgi:D-tyrosyl-tRNA(Tyr) deacylase
MRLVIQRVSRAQVTIDGESVGRIGAGLVVLAAVAPGDDDRQIDFLVDKLVHLRVFPDDRDKMNRSIIDVGGELLVVSQFTLYGDCRKGRRPSFTAAAPPEQAMPVYLRFIERLRAAGLNVACGRFGAMMQIELVNDGPVTLILDSPPAVGGEPSRDD